MSFLSNKKEWTSEDMAEMEGKTVIVTGANSGLGLEASKKFLDKGADLVMACRSSDKAEKASEEIREQTDSGNIEIIELDLASLSSIQNFVEEFKADREQLHILCNNAGVMAIPRQETEDGFEKQFGVNHLGHFSLTAQLFEILKETEGTTRVVTQSSMIHKRGKINLDDLMMEEDYDKWKAYAQSKLANLIFGQELEKRIEKEDLNVKSVVCHPGYSSTDLQFKGPRQEGTKLRIYLAELMNLMLGQSAEKGALPMLYAATSEEIEGGKYVGPDGFKNMRGYPKVQDRKSYSSDTSKRLWELSEELTGIEFDL